MNSLADALKDSNHKAEPQFENVLLFGNKRTLAYINYQ